MLIPPSIFLSLASSKSIDCAIVGSRLDCMCQFRRSLSGISIQYSLTTENSKLPCPRLKTHPKRYCVTFATCLHSLAADTSVNKSLSSVLAYSINQSIKQSLILYIAHNIYKSDSEALNIVVCMTPPLQSVISPAR